MLLRGTAMLSRPRLLLPAVALLAPCVSLPAQKLSGEVRDSASQAPIAKARVYAWNDERFQQTTTDSRGAFRLKLHKGTYQLAIAPIGSAGRQFDSLTVRNDTVLTTPLLVAHPAADTSRVYSWFEVSRLPRHAAGNRSPECPPDRPIASEFRFTVGFVVTTAGRVDPATITIDGDAPLAYRNAVLAVLPDWRFEPARIGDDAVAMHGFQGFWFRIVDSRTPVRGNAVPAIYNTTPP